jgi:negative regulator of sigma E activity
VGDRIQTLPATRDAKEVSFEVALEQDLTIPVRAELLDSSGNLLAGGYYVYCRLANP